MGTRVRELRRLSTALPSGDSTRDPTRVYEDELWRWSLDHPGEKPHRS